MASKEIIQGNKVSFKNAMHPFGKTDRKATHKDFAAALDILIVRPKNFRNEAFGSTTRRIQSQPTTNKNDNYILNIPNEKLLKSKIYNDSIENYELIGPHNYKLNERSLKKLPVKHRYNPTTLVLKNGRTLLKSLDNKKHSLSVRQERKPISELQRDTALKFNTLDLRNHKTRCHKWVLDNSVIDIDPQVYESHVKDTTEKQRMGLSNVKFHTDYKESFQKTNETQKAGIYDNKFKRLMNEITSKVEKKDRLMSIADDIGNVRDLNEFDIHKNVIINNYRSDTKYLVEKIRRNHDRSYNKEARLRKLTENRPIPGPDLLFSEKLKLHYISRNTSKSVEKSYLSKDNNKTNFSFEKSYVSKESNITNGSVEKSYASKEGNSFTEKQQHSKNSTNSSKAQDFCVENTALEINNDSTVEIKINNFDINNSICMTQNSNEQPKNKNGKLKNQNLMGSFDKVTAAAKPYILTRDGSLESKRRSHSWYNI